MGRPNIVGTIDWEKFGDRVRREIDKTGLSYRDLAACLDGVGHATLHRVAHGKLPLAAENYLWFCKEFSIDPLWAYRNQK